MVMTCKILNLINLNIVNEENLNKLYFILLNWELSKGGMI